jgi:Putative porin
MRGRLRFGLNYQYDSNLSFGARLRSEGSTTDQQSANFTLGTSSENAPIAIGIDRAFIKYQYKGLTAWTGKNTNSFYYHDEFFWSENVSHEGVYAEYEFRLSGGWKIKPAAGFFIITSNGTPFRSDRTQKALQIHVNHKTAESELNFATGLFKMDSLGNTPDGAATFPIDYNLSVTTAKYSYNAGTMPISIAANYIINTSDLTTVPTIVANNHQDQKKGYSLTLEYGRLKAKNDYLFGFTYAHIEKYAIVDYFAQDDYMRWGFTGASGTRSSNFQGFELKAAYAFGPKCNITARTFIVNGIAPNKPAATLETNNRFRLDMSIGF